MDAVLDVGNTRIKLGFFEKDQLISTVSFPTAPASEIYRHLQAKEFQNCILSSVVDLPEHVISYLRSKCKKLLVLGADTILPIKNNYATPGSLGPDRLALAVAVAETYPSRNVLAVSLGTCVTYNVITDKGTYEGGAISPGLHMRLNAMHHYTAKLPLLEPEEIVDIVGKDTKSSMLSGVISGLSFEIEGFAKELSKKYKDLLVILSGGDSRYVAGKLSLPVEVQPDLALTGLYKILSFNVKKAR